MLEGQERRRGVRECVGNSAACEGGKKGEEKTWERTVRSNFNHGYTMLPPTTASFAGDS